MSGNITPYVNLITSEHADKIKFTSMVSQTVQPSADLLELYKQITQLYDLDYAVGQQLDVVGQWVGITRNLSTPLAGVYLAFDTGGVGFDQGLWMGPNDPASGLVSLPDEFYRLIIQVKVINNHWDGSKSQAVEIGNAIFGSFGYNFFIQDNADLSMDMGIICPSYPSAIALALLTGSKFDIKPAGVYIRDYIYSEASGPIFSFDIGNSFFSGFDNAGWAQIVAA